MQEPACPLCRPGIGTGCASGLPSLGAVWQRSGGVLLVDQGSLATLLPSLKPVHKPVTTDPTNILSWMARRATAGGQQSQGEDQDHTGAE